MTNPIIEKAQRKVGIRMIERRQERLAAALETGQITKAEINERQAWLEARKEAKL